MLRYKHWEWGNYNCWNTKNIDNTEYQQGEDFYRQELVKAVFTMKTNKAIETKLIMAKVEIPLEYKEHNCTRSS